MSPMMTEMVSEGYYYYLATSPDTTLKTTKFVHALHRKQREDGGIAEIRVSLSPIIGLAKKFDRLTVVRAYAEFLNRTRGIEHDFCVILRPAT